MNVTASTAQSAQPAPPVPSALDGWLDTALRRFAPISPGALGLLRMPPDVEGDERALIRFISSEPTLLARVIATANARPFNPQDHAITDVAHAVRRLGVREVWRIATALALGAHARVLPEVRPAKRALWVHAFTVAHAARCVGASAARDGIDPERLFVAGLLHDIGLAVLLSVEPRRCATALATAAEPMAGLASLLETEDDLPSHSRIAAEVCRRWRLPEGLVALVGSHGLEHPLDAPASVQVEAAALALGHRIAEQATPVAGDAPRSGPDDVPLLATFLRVPAPRLDAIRASIRQAAPRIAQIAASA